MITSRAIILTNPVAMANNPSRVDTANNHSKEDMVNNPQEHLGSNRKAMALHKVMVHLQVLQAWVPMYKIGLTWWTKIDPEKSMLQN